MYSRRADEYVRPRKTLSLAAEVADPSEVYRRYVRGSAYHQHVPTPPVGFAIDLELVPEPFNPWDATALAVDVAGQRFGYVPAGEAAVWHDVVGAMNRTGYSVWLSADVATYAHEDLGICTTAVIRIPNHQWAARMADRFGLGSRVMALLSRLDQSTREDVFEECWFGFSRDTVRRLAVHSGDFPEFSWPTSPPIKRLVKRDLPGIFRVYVRELVLREREAAAARRSAERERVRQEREVEKLRKTQERQRALDERRIENARKLRALSAEVAALLGQGLSTQAMATRLGVPVSRVAVARRQLPSVDPATYNRKAAADRRTRAEVALERQRAGQTRRQIAAHLGLSMESVAALLRDAKFYENPNSDLTRRALALEARIARLNGETRAEFSAKIGLTKQRSVEAWRDADALPG